jgi:hypothetical protein
MERQLSQIELTEAQQRLIDTGKVIFVDKHSDEIPESERNMIRRGLAGNFGSSGLACTLLRDDGIVLIVTEGELNQHILRHEFIHAAQCHASPETMKSALDAAIQIGRPLVSAIRAKLLSNPECENAHRDLAITQNQWEMQAVGKATVEAFVVFQFYQDLYPTKETSKMASGILGFDYPRGAYAAMTACLAAECDYEIDPMSDLAREIVAYTFEHMEHEIIDDMLAEAGQLLDTQRRM